ncbi:MAG: cyclopropane-fatty-acyl-phospholipid synthase family protein [Halarsenatibacteraceae bacterium]
MNLDKILAKGWVPDLLLRLAVKSRLSSKLRRQRVEDIEERSNRLKLFIEDLKEQPIAIKTDRANEQHYELPSEFFEKILGDNLKYSSGYWEEEVPEHDLEESLTKAEKDMLELTLVRADLHDGQNILELGAGWGSLTLFMAERMPQSRITAISNSKSQIEYIKAQAVNRGLENIEVISEDINNYQLEPGKYERVVSVEMFEHMRNYQRLFAKVNSSLKPAGKLFIHIFNHHTYPFLYENKSESDWMTRHFFAGGTMPSQDLFNYFADGFDLENHWAVSGEHYQKTLEAWLKMMDKSKAEIQKIFIDTYGSKNYQKWWNYWRTFFIASAEFFGYAEGNEWFISHYLYKK